jgi:ribosome biogenesis GTPase A
MLKLIKEYLKLCISSKKSLKKEIIRLDKVIKQLYEITARQELLFEEYSRKSYKEKWKKEHEKLKELEKILESGDNNGK